jgi:hypothetical protein
MYRFVKIKKSRKAAIKKKNRRTNRIIRALRSADKTKAKLIKVRRHKLGVK